MAIKKSITYLLLFAVLMASCNNSGNNKNNETDSTEVVESVEINDTEADPKDRSNKLAEFLKDNKFAIEQFQNLKKAIANQDNMKSIEDIEQALEIRDTLMRFLNNEKWFYTYMERDDADRFYDEFEAIGMQVVEAEGMFGSLAQAPIFEKVIEKVADEPYILNNKIHNLNASSHGSEYPYFDITEEMEIVPLAEKMLTKYPGHKYNKNILEMLGYALYPLTDFHRAPDDFANYIVGGYDVSAYPGATDISFHKTFIEKYSKSRFAKVVEKILGNPSTLSASEFDMLYLIEVPDLIEDSVFSDEKLNEKLKKLPKDVKTANDGFKYLWLGIDVPHTIMLRDGDENRGVLVYRFYDKKEPAEKSLARIKKIIPKAKLVEYQLTEADKKYKN